MKIAWVHSHFYNWMGGTKFVLEVVRHLRQRADVEIVVQNGAPAVIKRFTDAGITVHNLGSPSTNSPRFWIALPCLCRRDASKLQHVLDERNIQVVITSMFPMNHIASMLRNKSVHQFCFEPFAFFWDRVMVGSYGLTTTFLLRILRLLYHSFDIKGTRASDILFTLTPDTEKAIRNIYGRETVLTYLGVNTAFYKPTPHPGLAARYAGRKLLLHNTDFTPPKGTDFLLRALPAIAARVPGLKLLITCSINDQTKIDRLKATIAGRGLAETVDVLGFVDIDLLPAYYSAADLVVYPGTSQGGGTAAVSLFVLEAMSCGTPVLRSNDSLTEVLDKVNGELFDPQDEREFTDKTVALLNDRALLHAYSEKARPYVIGKYSWDTVAETIYTTLETRSK